jgi:curved DNA-binding protein CbpA
MTKSAGFVDYYDVLQLSPNADQETIDRVYRMLAKRHHPDNHATRNPDKFRFTAEAHRILSDPEQRAAFDARYEENRASLLKTVDETSNIDTFAGDQRIFDGILSLLYISRRRDAQKGGMGSVQLERLLGCPPQHLEFHTWYLRQKGWIEHLENGQLTITANGVDRVMAANGLILSPDRLLTENSRSQDGPTGNGELEANAALYSLRDKVLETDV